MRRMAENQSQLEQKLLEALTPENLESLIKLLRLVRRLDEVGILDSLSNLLSDEVVEDLARNLLTTNAIKLLNEYDRLLSIMAKLAEPGVRDGIEKVLDLVSALNNVGLLNAMRSLLGDPEVLSELTHVLINEGSLYLVNNLVNALFEASINAVREVNADGKSTVETVSELLRDGDARRGLRFILLTAKYLGKHLAGEVVK